MSFDTTTTITWASEADQHNPDLADWRRQLLKGMTASGKTNGDYLIVSPVTTTRYWLDQAAAEEFVGEITIAAATYNCTIVSVEYGTR